MVLTKSSTSKLSMMRLLNRSQFDFMKGRFVALVVSVFLILIAVGGFVQKGQNAYGVDFVGGDLLTLSFTQKISENQVRAAIGIPNAGVQYQRDYGNNREDLTIRTPSDQAEDAEAALMRAHPEAGFQRLQLDKVQAVIGGEFKNKAMLALGLGMIGILPTS
ncbi:MAG: hypothetical protein HC904_14635 [Blastochloris sp.]|nr:hypothetical protein [Blastochloris sp.]